jgi:hypothetical protein
MKTLNILLIILLIASGCSSKADKKGELPPRYPKAQVVFDQFFDNYHVDITAFQERSQTLVFTKEKDGWHIQTQEWSKVAKKYETVKDEVFWSRKDKAYNEVDFPTGKNEETTKLKTRLVNNYNQFRNGEFDVHPYYGYDGWYHDVVEELEGRPQLRDSLLYSLARAYASTSNDLLSAQYANASGKERFALLNDNGQNSMTQSQVKKFLAYEKKTNDTYYKLYKQNPDFETIIGNIFNKYSNEIVNTYFILRYYQNEETARKALKDGLYDAFLISLAKNYLSSCAPNAILFTNGDNDTFPLLYAQTILGFRKDVTIINMSLANVGRYLTHLREPILGAMPVEFTLAADKYKNQGIRDIVLMEQEKNTREIYLDIHKALNFIADDMNASELNDAKYSAVPSSKFRMRIDKENIIKNNIVSPNKQSDIVEEMTWKIKGRYIYKNNLAVLDIIATNNWKRPIYFASTAAPSSYLGLNDYMQKEGLNYRLVPIRSRSVNPNSLGRVDAEIMYDNMMSKFDWSGVKGFGKNSPPGHKRMANNYQLQFYTLAETLAAEGDTIKAKEVLDKCTALFPVDGMENTYFFARNIELYLNINALSECKPLITGVVKKGLPVVHELLDKDPFTISSDEIWNLKTELGAITSIKRSFDRTFAKKDPGSVQMIGMPNGPIEVPAILKKEYEQVLRAEEEISEKAISWLRKLGQKDMQKVQEMLYAFPDAVRREINPSRY